MTVLDCTANLCTVVTAREPGASREPHWYATPCMTVLDCTSNLCTVVTTGEPDASREPHWYAIPCTMYGTSACVLTSRDAIEYNASGYLYSTLCCASIRAYFVSLGSGEPHLSYIVGSSRWSQCWQQHCSGSRSSASSTATTSQLRASQRARGTALTRHSTRYDAITIHIYYKYVARAHCRCTAACRCDQRPLATTLCRRLRRRCCRHRRPCRRCCCCHRYGHGRHRRRCRCLHRAACIVAAAANTADVRELAWLASLPLLAELTLDDLHFGACPAAREPGKDRRATIWRVCARFLGGGVLV
jgi:hypothetical protein